MPQTLIELAIYPIELEHNIRKVISKEDYVVMKIEKRSDKHTNNKETDVVVLYKTQEYVAGGLNDFWDILLKEVYGAKK